MHIGGTALAMSTSIARTPAMLGHSMSTRTMFVRTSVQSAETFMNGGLETICASVCPSLQLAMPLTVRIWTLWIQMHLIIHSFWFFKNYKISQTEHVHSQWWEKIHQLTNSIIIHVLTNRLRHTTYMLQVTYMFHEANSITTSHFQTFLVMLRWERLFTGYPSNHLRGCSALPTNWASQRGSSQRRAREGPSKIWSSSCCSSGNGGAQSTQSNHWHYCLWAAGTTLRHCNWTPLVCFGGLL